MTTEEFNFEFDILYNNIASNQAPGLNTYEKSLFLTKAQEELLKNYFNPKGNRYLEGFDDNAKRQEDFSRLITVAEKSPITPPATFVKINSKSLVFEAPEDILISLTEVLRNDSGKQFIAVPIGFEEYQRLMAKPFSFPFKREAWRLYHLSGDTLYYEVIARTPEDFSPKYVRRPNPIILEDLTGDYEGLLINGKSEKSECELSESIHREILTRAVELAKIAFSNDADALQSGQRAE